jgi:hypothetical protein
MTCWRSWTENNCHVEARLNDREPESIYAKMGDAPNALLAQFSDKELAVILSFLKKANDTQP